MAKGKKTGGIQKGYKFSSPYKRRGGVQKGYKYPYPLTRPKRKTATLSECKKWAKQHKVKSLSRWKILFNKGLIPKNMPLSIWRYPEWQGGQHFFNNGKPRVKFWSYTKSKIYIQSLRITTKEQFHKLMKQKKIPPQIPSNPELVYCK